MSVYEKIKSDYENFVEKNSKEENITRYITEMNYLEKLEELAVKNNLEKELIDIKSKKEVVLNKLKEKGLQKK
ncbi:MAG: hypothetical protein IJY61_03780 [Candidatus Gastranaerophilales bacterium]|nr:hypothetical protein [Candidatus Gastranaerophilales bacterium]